MEHNQPTTNPKLIAWIEEVRKLCTPDSIHWCDGSEQETAALCNLLVKTGTFKKLNPEKRPNSYLALSDPSDVARVEDRTFICSLRKQDAGPTNNWMHPKEMKATLSKLFSGCMRGRTMYIIPFSMGPLGSTISQIGVEITDSPYVVVNMKLMTRIGTKVIDVLGNGDFVPCIHSVGMPLSPGQKDSPWPCSEQKYIVHFPEERLIWSFGSGYGGNALLGKKCLALRIASVMARDEGWLAEHMLILGVQAPDGERTYVAAAFPSACGKTNLAMLIPPKALKEYKVTTVGDDIAWINPGKDGRLYAINPEAGYFGVAPGTSQKSTPTPWQLFQGTRFSRTLPMTPDGDVWWEGDGNTSAGAYRLAWRTLDSAVKASCSASQRASPHRRTRTRLSILQWEDPAECRYSAFIFGGRRSSIVPGIPGCKLELPGLHAATMGSGNSRSSSRCRGESAPGPDGDASLHWLSHGRLLQPLAAIRKGHSESSTSSAVNWFRKDQNGQFLWPGFGENMRILKWIIDRVQGAGMQSKVRSDGCPGMKA